MAEPLRDPTGKELAEFLRRQNEEVTGDLLRREPDASDANTQRWLHDLNKTVKEGKLAQDESFREGLGFIGQGPGQLIDKLPYDKMRPSTNVSDPPGMPRFGFNNPHALTLPYEGARTPKSYPLDPEMSRDIEADAARIKAQPSTDPMTLLIEKLLKESP